MEVNSDNMKNLKSHVQHTTHAQAPRASVHKGLIDTNSRARVNHRS